MRWALKRVVLALVVAAMCLVLPVGALGAIDLSFTSSVGVPQPRTRSQQPEVQELTRSGAMGAEEVAAAASPPSVLVLVVAAAAALVLVVRAARSFGSVPVLRLRSHPFAPLPPRGPPVVC